MLRLVPIIVFSSIASAYDAVTTWELNMHYECGVVVSDSGKIGRDTKGHESPVTFEIIAYDTTIVLRDYQIDAAGVTSDQVFISDQPNFNTADTIRNWKNSRYIDMTWMENKLKAKVYAWIPEEVPLQAGGNEVRATWSVDCY